MIVIFHFFVQTSLFFCFLFLFFLSFAVFRLNFFLKMTSIENESISDELLNEIFESKIKSIEC